MNYNEVTSRAHLKLHNVTFKCAICEEHFNIKDTECFMVQQLNGCLPVAKTNEGMKGPMQLVMQAVTVCKDCFFDEDLHFEDKESPIIVAQQQIPPEVQKDLQKKVN